MRESVQEAEERIEEGEIELSIQFIKNGKSKMYSTRKDCRRASAKQVALFYVPTKYTLPMTKHLQQMSSRLPLLGFAVIDCTREYNWKLCKNQEVTDSLPEPVIKFYKSKKDKWGGVYDSDHDPFEIEKFLKKKGASKVKLDL